MAAKNKPLQDGPRIVINPSTFHNEKDAACVMMNEALRIVMEDTGFEPQSEPTDEQRRFFSDTAYADDELQLRRTIIARICTFDTSVEDPTDEQLQEAVEFLDTVVEVGAPQNEWEQNAVQRLREMLDRVQHDGEQQAVEPPVPEGPSVQADEGGGQAAPVQQDDEERRRREQAAKEATEAETDGAESAENPDGAEPVESPDDAKPAENPAVAERNPAVAERNPLQAVETRNDHTPLQAVETRNDHTPLQAVETRNDYAPAQPDATTRLGRDLQRLARSGKSDREQFIAEHMNDQGRYARELRNGVDAPRGAGGVGYDLDYLGKTVELTGARQEIETAAAKRLKDYDERKKGVEDRQMANHYTSDYTRDRDLGVLRRKESNHYRSEYTKARDLGVLRRKESNHYNWKKTEEQT